jgi:hypothetical protein
MYKAVVGRKLLNAYTIRGYERGRHSNCFDEFVRGLYGEPSELANDDPVSRLSTPTAYRFPQQSRATVNRSRRAIPARNETKPVMNEADDDGGIDVKLKMEVVDSVTIPMNLSQVSHHGHAVQPQSDWQLDHADLQDDNEEKREEIHVASQVERLGDHEDELSSQLAHAIDAGDPAVKQYHEVMDWVQSVTQMEKHTTQSQISTTLTDIGEMRVGTPATETSLFTRGFRSEAAVATPSIPPRSPASAAIPRARRNYVSAWTQTSPLPQNSITQAATTAEATGGDQEGLPHSTPDRASSRVESAVHAIATSSAHRNDNAATHLTLSETFHPARSLQSSRQQLQQFDDDATMMDLFGLDNLEWSTIKGGEIPLTSVSKAPVFTASQEIQAALQDPLNWRGQGVSKPIVEGGKTTRTSRKRAHRIDRDDEPVIIAEARVRRPRLRQVIRTTTRTETRRTVLTIRSRSASTSLGFH